MSDAAHSPISHLTSDCLDAVLACLDCYSLAVAQCVCQHWRAAAAADSLWMTRAALEFGLTALPPGFTSFKALFQKCQASPTLAPLKCEARLASVVASIQSWSVRIEQYSRPQPAGATPFGRGAVPGAVPASAQQQGRGPEEAQSSLAGAADGHQDGQGGRDVPLVCELMTCQHFIQNRQSVWIKFGLPQWIKEGEEEEEEEEDSEHGGPQGGSALGNAALAAGQRGRGGQQQQEEATWNLLVVEAVHESGHVLEVIRSEGFKMPQSDLEMLMQSHTEGLYAWEADAPPPAPQTEFHQALALAAGSGLAMPPGVLERHGMQRRALKLSRALSVVAYVHYEQLLPLVGLAQLRVPQSLRLPPMPLWTLAPPQAPALQSQGGGGQGEPGAGRAAAAAGSPGAMTLSPQREPAAYLHVDWCQLVTSGRRGSAWVALYLQWHESRFIMMGVEMTEQDVVMMPGSAELADLPGSPSLADSLASGRPPGCVSMALTHQQHLAGSSGAPLQQAGPAQHLGASAADDTEQAASAGAAAAAAGPGCSAAAAERLPAGGSLPGAARPAADDSAPAAAADLLNQVLSDLALESRPEPATSPGNADPAASNADPAASNSDPAASNPGPSASTSFPPAASSCSGVPGTQPHDASSSPPWSSLRLPSNPATTCSTLAELCAADGMVDFSLWSNEGRLLLGRSGVELWSRSNETVNYCCHFLVDGIADPSFRQSLWENTLWVRPDAGAGGGGGAAFALSLTFMAARALFGEVADEWH